VTVNHKTIKGVTGSGWISSYAAGMWVTNKGIYFSVVHDDKEDIVEYIPYKKINDVMAKRTVFRPMFVINARDNKYKFDINLRLFSYIKPARKYIGEKYQGSPSGLKKQPAVESQKDDSRHGGEEITRHDLQTMDEYEFEHLVAETWREMGWNAEVTQSSSDRGVDVIATKETPFRERHLIQAKRYSADNKVGSGEMQKYSGLYSRDEQVDQVIVVTTSSFTSEAKEISSTRDVKTVNGQELLNLVRSETENNT
jgi:hypothetical protein